MFFLAHYWFPTLDLDIIQVDVAKIVMKVCRQLMQMLLHQMSPKLCLWALLWVVTVHKS